jgi:hypothetical protein
MTKFLNKKEQVIDLKLTSYGHYLLSIGDFGAKYYAFYDDNILYDGAYGGITESQSAILDRIQNKTAYMEGVVLFEDLEDRVTNNKGAGLNYYDLDITPTKENPRIGTFRYDSAMGDAYLDGESQDVAPAWKIVALNGRIATITEKEPILDLNIPQLNIELNYVLSINPRGGNPLELESVEQYAGETPTFVDGNIIKFKMDDLVIYTEEVNTDILTHNFDVEIFEVQTESVANTMSTLLRRYFVNEIPQIVDGLMVTATPQKQMGLTPLSSSVEYYFDFLEDQKVDQNLACRNADSQNKQSYYIDLDFDCTRFREESIYYDIYGSEVEPEICLD